MHHPTDRLTHTTAFVTPVVEHWLEREIALCITQKKVIYVLDFDPHSNRLRVMKTELYLKDIIKMECTWCTNRNWKYFPLSGYYGKWPLLKAYRSLVLMVHWSIVVTWKEGNVLFNDVLNTFYLRLYGVGHMVKNHSDSKRGNVLPPYGLLFPIRRVLLYAPSHKHDSTYHGLCYTSHGALAGTRNTVVTGVKWNHLWNKQYCG